MPGARRTAPPSVRKIPPESLRSSPGLERASNLIGRPARASFDHADPGSIRAIDERDQPHTRLRASIRAETIASNRRLRPPPASFTKRHASPIEAGASGAQNRPERRIIPEFSAMPQPDSTAASDLLYTVEDGIGRVTFNRPQARNALTFAMYERLAQICEAANGDRSLKVLILTGQGDKAFAAGTDINQFRAFKTPQDALDYESRLDRILGALEACRVPTIAAIAGACTGGGTGIAACCDLRIAAANAKFGFPIARTLGNCLSMASLSRLAALIGPARVKDLVFTARLLETAEAARIGLLNEVVDDLPALQRRTEELARLIAGNAPLTLRATKEALRRLQMRLSREEGEDLILMCYMSRDFREGMDAFLNKREPQWTGE